MSRLICDSRRKLENSGEISLNLRIATERIGKNERFVTFSAVFRDVLAGWHNDRLCPCIECRLSRMSPSHLDGESMKRPLSLLAVAGLVLGLSLSSAFSANESMTVTPSASSASTPMVSFLPGVWNADNCPICRFNVIYSGGFLYADMADWGTYGYSYSGGYQPIDIVSDDTFFYRGDYFRFSFFGGNQYRIDNISNGGDRNVAGAYRETYFPDPIPYPGPVPRPYPGPYPRPYPRPYPGPFPRPQPPRPQPPRPRPRIAPDA